MIPTIEQIVEDIFKANITKSQAVTWLHQHAEDAYQDLRDEFAARALAGLVVSNNFLSPHIVENKEQLAINAYQIADAMIHAREG